jgi:hypothetical protein
MERSDEGEYSKADEKYAALGWPSFPLLEASHTCMFCGQEIENRRFAVAVTARPEWEPGTYLSYSAHVECLRRVLHPDTFGFRG